MSTKSRTLHNIFPIILLLAAGLLIYSNSFGNQMFWDDNDGILNNVYIKDWHYWPKFFTENLIAGAGLISNYWRPMLLTVFSLEWHLWQNNVLGYHLVNTAFHILNAILLFLIFKICLKKKWPAFFLALIFLVHPLQTEAVTYVSGLADPLSVFFIFLGILSYLQFLQKNKKVFYWLTLPCYILALMSKETAIIMPILIFLVEWLYKRGERFSLAEIIKKYGPFILLAAIYIILRLTVLNFQNTLNLYNEENLFTSRLDIRILTFLKTLPIYLGLIFYPVSLHMERTIEIPTSLADPLVLAGIAITLISLFLIVRFFRQRQEIAFGMLWFFVGLLPVSNIFVPISGLIYEHWLYLPLIGIFITAYYLMEKPIVQYQLEKLLLVVMIALVIFFSWRTILRNADWRDPITFYNQTLQYAPDSYRVWNNLGMAYDDNGQYLLAERAYQTAASIDPANPIAYHNLGSLYFKLNRLDDAEKYFLEAIKRDQSFYYSYLSLAKIYLSTNNSVAAKNILQNYIDLNGPRTDVLYLLSNIYENEQDFANAQKYLLEAQKLQLKIQE